MACTEGRGVGNWGPRLPTESGSGGPWQCTVNYISESIDELTKKTGCFVLFGRCGNNTDIHALITLEIGVSMEFWHVRFRCGWRKYIATERYESISRMTITKSKTYATHKHAGLRAILPLREDFSQGGTYHDCIQLPFKLWLVASVSNTETNLMQPKDRSTVRYHVWTTWIRRGESAKHPKQNSTKLTSTVLKLLPFK